MRQYDAIVAGAGVAGATAALLLARRGLSVLVADRKPERESYKQLCTHFVQPHARPVMEKLGLSAALEGIGGVPTKAAFWTSAGWIDPPGDYAVEAGESDGALTALNMERRLVDPFMVDRMRATPGIELALGTAISPPERGDDGLWRATLDDFGRSGGDGLRHVAAPALIAADGRRSPIAKALDNRAELTGENQRACFFAYFEGVPEPAGNRSLFYLGDRSMAFLYPLGGTRALLSAYVPKEEGEAWRGDDQVARLVALFESFPDCPDLSAARPVTRMRGYRDYPNLVRRPVHRGAAFVGDAALSLDPMSGVGCSFAMTTADMAADALAEVLVPGETPAPDAVDTALEAYTARFDAFFPPHAKGIMADSVIAKTPETVRDVYARIVADPDLQRRFIALTGRLVSPSAFQRAYLMAGIKAKKAATAAPAAAAADA